MLYTPKYNLGKMDIGAAGWHAVYSANFQILDDRIHTYIGPFQFGEAVAAGDCCCQKADGKFWKAQASSDLLMPGLGLPLIAYAAGEIGYVKRVGPFVKTGWAWTVGGRIWLSTSVAGGLTQTKPTNYRAQCIGWASASNAITLMVNLTWE